jgi:CheY-like chemotaxis protein
MSVKEILEIIIEFLRVVASWPVIIFLILIIFRKKIGQLLTEIASNLASRIKKAAFGGAVVEFDEAQAQAQALGDTIDEAVKDKDLMDNPVRLVEFIKDQIKKYSENIVVTPIKKEQPERKPFHGKFILWVDDVPTNNTYESNLFRRLGANITTSLSTLDALEKLKNNRFDLIISDIHRNEMEGSNPDAGYELLESMNMMKLNIPLIFYTGSVGKINMRRSQSAFGAADVSKELSNLVLKALTI